MKKLTQKGKQVLEKRVLQILDRWVNTPVSQLQYDITPGAIFDYYEKIKNGITEERVEAMSRIFSVMFDMPYREIKRGMTEIYGMKDNLKEAEKSPNIITLKDVNEILGIKTERMKNSTIKIYGDTKKNLLRDFDMSDLQQTKFLFRMEKALKWYKMQSEWEISNLENRGFKQKIKPKNFLRLLDISGIDFTYNGVLQEVSPIKMNKEASVDVEATVDMVDTTVGNIEKDLSICCLVKEKTLSGEDKTSYIWCKNIKRKNLQKGDRVTVHMSTPFLEGAVI